MIIMDLRKHFIFSLFLIMCVLLAHYPVSAQEAEITTETGKDKRKRQDNSQLFIEAKKNLILGDIEKAEKLFKTCTVMDPEDGASWYELSRIRTGENDPETAIQYAVKAVESDPDNVWYMLHLSNLYKRTSQFKKASEILELLLERFPDRYEYYNDLAVTYLFSRDYDKAIELYNTLEEQFGITEETSLQKQKIYLLQNDPENAAKEIEKLIEALPGEARYYSILAELYLSTGENEKALAAYKKVLELDPSNPYIHISLSDYYRKEGDQEKAYDYLKQGFSNQALEIDTKVNILLAYYTANEFYDEKKDEAFELSNILVETHPDDPKAYSIRADLLYQGKEFDSARVALRKVLSLDSSRYLVWEQLLFANSELKDFEAMGSDSKKTIRLFPQQPLPYLFSAVSSFQEKDYDEAIDALERGIRFVVDNELLKGQFYSYLGDAYHEKGEDEKAFENYEKALRIDPDNSIVLNNYAYYLSLQNKDLEKALEMAEKAVELDPDNGSNQDTYSWIFYKLGRYEEAREWIEKSLKNHNEDNGVILEHYGDILFKLGKEKEALKYWKRAREAGGGVSEFLEKKINDEKLYE